MALAQYDYKKGKFGHRRARRKDDVERHGEASHVSGVMHL